MDLRLVKIGNGKEEEATLLTSLPKYQSIEKACKSKMLIRYYYCLSFEYDFRNLNDTVHFAFSEPYSYSKIIQFITAEKEKQSLIPNDTQFFKADSLCKTLSGIDIPLLTITNNVNEENDAKEHVIATARVHPGETCGSWMMEGLLKYLLGGTKEAQECRSQIVFHIIPMLNPDGVILGNYRCDVSGYDLNRKYANTDQHLFPNIYNLKAKIKSIINKGQGKSGKRILAFFDMHAHSKKKSVFIYGPHFPLHNENYFKTRMIPKLLSESTQMFRYYSCKFRNEKSKLKAARIVVSTKFGIANSFTIEASFYGFIDSERKTIEFQRENYQVMVP